MKRGVIIHPDGHVGPAIINEERDELKQMQQIVGGNLTYYPYNRVPNMTVLLDEDGISRKLAFNTLAHAVFGNALDPILGTVLVMGATDDDGELESLTVDQVNIFLDPKGEDILNALATHHNEEQGLDYMEDSFGGELP